MNHEDQEGIGEAVVGQTVIPPGLDSDGFVPHLAIDLDREGNPLAERVITGLGFQLPTIFVRLLREYFSSGPYLYPGLGDLRFQSSRAPRTREEIHKNLDIDLLTNYRGDLNSPQAKLLVREDAVAIVTEGVSDGLRQAPTTINKFGGQLRETVWSGSIVIFALSKVPGESRLLGFETTAILVHYLPHIRASLPPLRRIRVSQLGATGKVKEMPDFFGTPLVIDYAYNENVATYPRHLPIRDIILNVTSQ